MRQQQWFFADYGDDLRFQLGWHQATLAICQILESDKELVIDETKKEAEKEVKRLLKKIEKANGEALDD